MDLGSETVFGKPPRNDWASRNLLVRVGLGGSVWSLYLCVRVHVHVPAWTRVCMYIYARKLAHTQGYFCMHEVHTCAIVDIFVQAALGSKISFDERLLGSSWRYLALNPLADFVVSFAIFACFSSSCDFCTQRFGR